MNTTDIRTLQLRIFDIFLEFERVCLENNLRFYLIAGTLLGAVRHKGFIPWDDDMDVAMPRKDYEILLNNAHRWFSYPYELDCRENNKEYPFRFAKVHDATTTFYENKAPNYVGGVYLDVFPYDGLPDGILRQKFHLWRHRIAYKIFYFSLRDPFKRGKKIDSYLILLLQKFVNTDRAYRRMKKLTTKYDFETSNYITDFDFGIGGIIKKETIGNSPAKVIFEGRETYGIKDWDEYLTTIYGDYMKLPPEDKRKPNHYVVYRNLELPYRQYKEERMNR